MKLEDILQSDWGLKVHETNLCEGAEEGQRGVVPPPKKTEQSVLLFIKSLYFHNP